MAVVPAKISRREQIVSQAARLFDEKGYFQTSMDDIAEAIGVRKPTLYHYFASKDAILFQIHEEFIDLLIARQDARTRLNMTPAQNLLEIMVDIIELMETHRGHVRTFFEHHRDLSDEFTPTIREKRGRYFASVEAIISKAQAEGTVSTPDIRLTTLSLFGMCNWGYTWYRSDGSHRPREIAYHFWSILLYGVAVRD